MTTPAKTAAMKTIWWKIRATYWARRKLKVSIVQAWQFAGSWVECYGIHEASPQIAAEEELEEWRQST